MGTEAKATPAAGLQPVITAKQVMDWLGIKRAKLYHLIDLGMPFRSLSEDDRTKVFVPAEVQEWLDGRKRTRERPTVTGAETRPRKGRPRKDEPKPGERKWMKGI